MRPTFTLDEINLHPGLMACPKAMAKKTHSLPPPTQVPFLQAELPQAWLKIVTPPPTVNVQWTHEGNVHMHVL